MVKYEDGKIYRIVCNITGEQYVGSTCETLCRRLAKHKVDYKRWKQGKQTYTTSFQIIERGDYEIVLIEDYPCENKYELHRRERFHVDFIECVNKLRPIVTKEERKETRKIYYNNNKEAFIKYAQMFSEKNKEKISEVKKIYRENNNEKISEYQKQYGENNKDKISENKKIYYVNNREKKLEKYACECGAIFCISCKSRHLKTKKHQEFIKASTNNMVL